MCDALRQVPGDAIERELDNDWRAANASALASNTHPGSRNSVLSLVVYTRGLDEATRERSWQALDIAAGAVLMASITASIIGTLVFANAAWKAVRGPLSAISQPEGARR